MAFDDLPRLGLRGRTGRTPPVAGPILTPRKRSSAHDELVRAHEELCAPQFGMKFTRSAGGPGGGGPARSFRVETRLRRRGGQGCRS
jgi:hypothetical protein